MKGSPRASAVVLAKERARLAEEMMAAYVEILQVVVGSLSVAGRDMYAERPQPNLLMEHLEAVLAAGRGLDPVKICDDDVVVAETEVVRPAALFSKKAAQAVSIAGTYDVLATEAEALERMVACHSSSFSVAARRTHHSECS